MRFLTTSIFTLAFAVQAALANGDPVQWRVDVAQYLDRTYNETSQMVDLFVALAGREDYMAKMMEEAYSSDFCGHNFLPLRAAKQNNIDFEKTIKRLSAISNERSPFFERRTRDPDDYLLVTYSPYTAEAFWVLEPMSPENITTVRATFDRMRPLWQAFSTELPASDRRGGASMFDGLALVGECSGTRDGSLRPDNFVPFFEPQGIWLSAPSVETLSELPLVQIELLQEVADFAEAIQNNNHSIVNRDVFNRLASARALKLESFDDLGLDSGGAKTTDNAGSNEIDDLNLGDLGLDAPTERRPQKPEDGHLL